jgi:hypothetical protein
MRLRFAALSLALSACVQPPALQADPDVEAGVAQLLERWAADGQTGKWEALKALYADDPAFTWVEQGRVAYANHAAVIAGVDKTAALKPQIVSTVNNVAVTPLGMAAASFRADVDMTFKSENSGFEFDGVMTGVAVWRDNRWQFLQAHLSAPK